MYEQTTVPYNYEMRIKAEIVNCHCNGNTEIISKNINISFKNKEYQISNASVEKCNVCGDIFIQDRTRDIIKETIGFYPIGVECAKLEEQIFKFFL